MKKLFPLILILLILIQVCSCQKIIPLSNTINYCRVDGFQNFRTGNYRIWLMKGAIKKNFCIKPTIFTFLCRTGLVTGKVFYDRYFKATDSISTSIGLIDANLDLDNDSSFSNNKVTLDDTSSTFSGHTMWVEEVQTESIKRGDQVDTLTMSLSVDLTGKLPGPMSIYSLVLTFAKESMPCSGIFIKPRVIKVWCIGSII